MKSIKRIAVATDFSNISRAAYKYGYALAQLAQAEFQLIHIAPKSSQEQDSEIKKTLTRLRRFANNKDVNCIVHTGTVVKTLHNLAKEGTFDLLILGTKGERGLLGKAFGGTAIELAKEAACPVLLIPPKMNAPQRIANIAYATSELSLDEHGIEALKDWAETFQATLHFLHVSRIGFNDKKVDVDAFMKDGAVPYVSRDLDYISVRGAIDAYTYAHPIDLVVAMTQHYSFWENLFHLSVTESLAWNSTVPLLLLHKIR